MARLTGPSATGVAALSQYFNLFVGAIEQGATIQQLWVVYRQAVGVPEGPIGEANLFDMNIVGGAAKALVNSEAALKAAEDNYPITSDMWAWAPWAQNQTDNYIGEMYQVRYQADVTGPDGTSVPVWLSTDWQGSLEGVTKGQLWARATQSAQYALDTYDSQVLAQMGLSEGSSLGGVSRVQIMRI